MVSVTLSPAVVQSADSSATSMTYRIVRQPVNGGLSGTPPDLIYRQHPGYPAGAGHEDGADSFTFTVSNGQCESPEATVSIVVTEVNDSPVADASATPLRSIIAANNLNAIAVLDGSRSADPENDPLQFTWLEGVTTIGTGMVATVTLPIGSHNIVLQVSDGLLSSTDTLTISIVAGSHTVQDLVNMLINSSQSRKSLPPLLATLKAATDALQRGSTGAAINQLQAFQNKVRAQIQPADPTLAAELINLAQMLIDSIDPVAKPKLTIGADRTQGAVHLNFSGNVSHAYVIEASSDMVHWESIGTAKHRGNGEFDFDDAKAAASSRFYRLRAQ